VDEGTAMVDDERDGEGDENAMVDGDQDGDGDENAMVDEGEGNEDNRNVMVDEVESEQCDVEDLVILESLPDAALIAEIAKTIKASNSIKFDNCMFSKAKITNESKLIFVECGFSEEIEIQSSTEIKIIDCDPGDSAPKLTAPVVELEIDCYTYSELLSGDNASPYIRFELVNWINGISATTILMKIIGLDDFELLGTLVEMCSERREWTAKLVGLGVFGSYCTASHFIDEMVRAVLEGEDMARPRFRMTVMESALTRAEVDTLAHQANGVSSLSRWLGLELKYVS